MSIRVIYPDRKEKDLGNFTKRQSRVVSCWFNLASLQHNLMYGKRLTAKSKTFASQSLFIVEFSPAAFYAMVQTGNPALKDFAGKTKKEKSVSFAPQPLTVDAAMQTCISEMIHYQGKEELKNMFLRARVMELLWLQQDNYLRSQELGPVYVKTEYDKERIVFARDYLLTHLDAPPSLIELAAIAGLNEFKLKRGFKEMFGVPVFAYLADVRLDMARRAIREKKKTITQIAFELGFASPQHFSMAFKKKFGMAPKRY